MLAGEQGLQELMRSLNRFLQEREQSRPGREVIRRWLGEEIGELKQVAPLDAGRIQTLAAGRPLVGVDGSVNAYGAAFPHVIHFFRALACPSTRSLEQGFSLVDIFYPELGKHRAELLEFIERARTAGESLPPDAACSHLVRAKLAALEVRAAIAAVKEYNPFLVLFDGGFLRYGGLAPQVWQEYRELAIAGDVVSIGVIEEVGTFDLARLLAGSYGRAYACDRDLLFGVLEPGEWLAVRADVELKKTYYTCFVRPGRHPQVIAYDFFAEQADRAADFIPLLFALTPRGSRGIPWWLDQVDAAARITRREVELLVATFLDRSLRERLFVPQRERRTL